jgi:hypothetical protein
MEYEENKGNRRNLAEPEDLLDRFAIALTVYFNVQALIDPDRTWLVFRICGHRAMAHLHKLDLLKLCQFLRVGRDLAWSSVHGFAT